VEVKEEAKAAAVRVAAVRGEATAEEVMEAAARVAVREAVMGVVVTEVAATAAATAAAVTAEVATEEATVEAAMAGATAADRTPRPHSSARPVAPCWQCTGTPCCRAPVPLSGSLHLASAASHLVGRMEGATAVAMAEAMAAAG
jgi:hypothetical protein